MSNKPLSEEQKKEYRRQAERKVGCSTDGRINNKDEKIKHTYNYLCDTHYERLAYKNKRKEEMIEREKVEAEKAKQDEEQKAKDLVIFEQKKLEFIDNPELKILAPSRAEVIKQTFEPMVEMLINFEDAYSEIIAEKETEITPQLVARAKRLRLDVAKVRTTADKARKEQKASVLAEGKAIDGSYNILKWAVEEKETELSKIEKHFELIEKERLEKLQNKRAGAMHVYIEDSENRDWTKFDDEEFEAILSQKRATYEAEIEAQKQAELDKIAKEKAEAEEREAIRLENERLKAEAEKAKQAELDRLKAERIAKEKAEAERVELARIEAEKQAIIDAEKQAILDAERKAKEDAERKLAEAEAKRLADIKLAEAKAEAERLEAKRIADEKQAIIDAERKAIEAERRAIAEAEAKRVAKEKAKAERIEAERLEAERLEAERIEAEKQTELNKGDAEKFQNLITDLENIKTKYSFKSKKNIKMYEDVSKLINKVINHINSKEG